MGSMRGWIRMLSFCLALLFLRSPLCAEDQPAAITPTSSSEINLTWHPEEESPCLQFGLGYPDLRLRYHLSGPIDLEAKVALAQGEQAYGGRLYWRMFHLGPAGILLGGEVGFLDYNSIYTLSGTGDYGEIFVGAQYRFMKRWAALVDFGPAKIQVRADNGQSLAQQQWIFNTALYYVLF